MDFPHRLVQSQSFTTSMTNEYNPKPLTLNKTTDLTDHYLLSILICSSAACWSLCWHDLSFRETWQALTFMICAAFTNWWFVLGHVSVQDLFIHQCKDLHILHCAENTQQSLWRLFQGPHNVHQHVMTPRGHTSLTMKMTTNSSIQLICTRVFKNIFTLQF